jgi:hypothetical protein
MATGYYMGQGIMLERGETYEMKKEELIQVLDKYADHLKNTQAECDELKMEILRMKYPNEPLLKKCTIQ